jgi:hypothetical protein
MKKLKLTIAILALITMTAPAVAIELDFHGDLNNRFLVYTNRNDWLNPEQQGVIGDNTVDETYGEIKYRFWFEGSDNDGNVKAVYAIEVGGVRFGRSGSGKGQGGSFSGDGVNIETRWAYLDFQLPFIERKSRLRSGLQPTTVNEYFWQETAMGVHLNGDINDMWGYQAAWIRVTENLARDDSTNDIKDGDNFYGRINVKPNDDLKLGVFGTYLTQDGERAKQGEPNINFTPRDYLYKEMAEDETGLGPDTDFYIVGVDGSWKPGNFFLNWDMMYEGGSIDDIILDDSEFSGVINDDDFDLSAWFVHADLGYKMDKHTFTYTFWYASGDDDAGDDDFEGFLSVDVDRTDSMALFEGAYADDVSYFTERPYMLDKGFIMNKIAWDFKWTEKFKIGAAGMFMMTAEDIEYTDNNGNNQAEDTIGIELNGFLKYMLYKNVEFAFNAGYLWADDAMDAFEVERDGNSDENIFVTSARIRYKF